MRTFLVENFGCRATQADGAALESLLQSQNLVSVARSQQADLIVLNTCTVTANADSDVRAAVRRAHRENPKAKILVTGCYAQRAPAELAELPGVEWVVGNSHKSQIADIVAHSEHYHTGIHQNDLISPREFLSAPITESLTDRARPILKIQDGCNHRCSFCIIPTVRGPSRFLTLEAVVKQVLELSQRYVELVLAGINLGRWGREPGSQLRLPDLLRALLDQTPIQRIRLSSVEPMDWSDELIELMSSHSRIAQHVHMPLQSGADAILRGMRRKYRSRHYNDRLAEAASAMPDAAFGADVMTGFPGETEPLFKESLAFIESLPFTYLHVFTYSERPGTSAALLPGSVPVAIRRERTRILRGVSDRKNCAFRQRMVGRRLSAVSLEQSPLAITSNNVQVEMRSWPGPNQMVAVLPSGLTTVGMTENKPFAVIQLGN